MDLKYKEQLCVYQSGEAWSPPTRPLYGCMFEEYLKTTGVKQGFRMAIKRTTPWESLQGSSITEGTTEHKVFLLLGVKDFPNGVALEERKEADSGRPGEFSSGIWCEWSWCCRPDSLISSISSTSCPSAHSKLQLDFSPEWNIQSRRVNRAVCKSMSNAGENKQKQNRVYDLSVMKRGSFCIHATSDGSWVAKESLGNTVK